MSAGLTSPEADDAGGPAPVLAARHLTRRFGRVTALDDATLEVYAGGVTCLLGDNGAGKSTLIKVLAGVHPPTEGAVEVDGRAVVLGSPRDAQRHGIAVVYQDLAVIPLMSVWRNFFLGREPTVGHGPLRRLDAAACRAATRDALHDFAIRIDDVDRPLGTLSGGERQSVAIARAVHAGARALILDEPTAALGVRQAGLVLEHIRRVRDAGVGVLLVTHNPRHAREAGDAFVVLRRGRVAARFRRGEVEAAGLIELMAGVADPPEGRAGRE
ncbi:MAG TPA: ATP-binding cassette domain-containing protein [Longimicrobiales bacterium]|nr:ATP-binding cassette domain-containing protein [Longimicrobiales bacterium]